MVARAGRNVRQDRAALVEVDVAHHAEVTVEIESRIAVTMMCADLALIDAAGFAGSALGQVWSGNLRESSGVTQISGTR